MNIQKQFMELCKFIILFLILCNIPSYSRAYFGSSFGSITSYASSLFLLIYFVFAKERHALTFPFILLGILYYMLSALGYTGIDTEGLIKEFIRFMIVAICASELLYKTERRDIYVILLIGSLSVIINAFIFPLANANFYPTYGRYSGFYLNPNYAGSICLMGFALSFTVHHKWLKIAGQLCFTLAGILTFSRSFIVIWFFLILISIYNNRKNVMVPMIGAGVLIILFALSSVLSLNQSRFSALKSIFDSDTQVQTKTMTEDSRSDTWSLYTDIILDKPIFGNGYAYMQQKSMGLPGIHNSYLLVLGEAGILPFLLMLGIYSYLLIKSFYFLKTSPEYFYLTCVVMLGLMVGHGYFSNYYSVLISMFIYINIRHKKPNIIVT
ncbi:O-antigen ligase family protein [Zobellia barbeyronii]|uniref:O-antigen ligase family protein n=1 Tax=Zobellia barbeyronii TaxID=2748009 RepID=A0ABS5WIH2_9FLAO|nr:O-antigen ligase family protein [Zobellia barbeyronii]MBT2163201.1 O-antigen ligase family protein [Zobellia barbeyronii]